MGDIGQVPSRAPFYISRETTYGEMTPLVQQFFSRLVKLPLEAWVRASVRLDRATEALTDQSVEDSAGAAARAKLRQVMDEMPAALTRAKRRVHDISDVATGITAEAVRGPMTKAAVTASLALIARPYLSAQEFVRLYYPFAEIIPVETLERAAGGPGSGVS
jgi:hypothetical protein